MEEKRWLNIRDPLSQKLTGRAKKCYMRLYFHFVDASVTNAYIVHKQLDHENMSNKDFRQALYAGLLTTALIQPKREIKSHKPHMSKNIRLKSSDHQPKRCAKCSTKKNPVCNVPLYAKSQKQYSRLSQELKKLSSYSCNLILMTNYTLCAELIL
ncbi:hypothetical protein PR048_031918 [Dryococelus australis]|uniref:PiggyBac transposable element-derived protein domain-containing protein n=1 Tax=Dryococelus australis TaxID=614101 RepID=A0ABQ9GAM4_9NEOP|nr:hypothetical protein PR048_031918 [Dryococelus australis]